MTATTRPFASAMNHGGGKGPAIYFPVILSLVFIAFLPSLRGSFLNWDDDTHILENNAVGRLDLARLRRIFTSTVNDTYIPLTILSFTLEYQFFGYSAFVYHLDNLLLHLGVVGLIFIFAIRLGLSPKGAGLASLLFGIHPMHVESVAWITERKDVLYAFFYMLSLIQYSLYVQLNRWGDWALSLFYGLLSILAKPMALSLPLILFLCDWFWQRPLNRNTLRDTIKEKAPFFLVIVSITGITYSLHARIPGTNPGEAILIWIWTFSFYIQKFFLPLDLSPFYALPKPVSLAQPEYLIAVGVFCLFWALLLRQRCSRWLVFAGLFYFASIFFLLRFDDLKDNHVVADRFMYLPSLGFCLLAGWGFEKILNKLKTTQAPKITRAFVYGGLGLVLLALGVKTYGQSRLWANNIYFWDWLIEKRDNIPSAYNYRGVAYLAEGRYEPAIADFNRALKLQPSYVKPYYNNALAYRHLGKYPLAIQNLNDAIRIDPDCIRCYNLRGLIYKKMGQYDLAVNDYTAIIQKDPTLYKAYFNRALAYSAAGEWSMALEDLSRSIELNGRFPNAYGERARVYVQLKDWERALADYNQAIRLAPQAPWLYEERALVSRLLDQDLGHSLADHETKSTR